MSKHFEAGFLAAVAGRPLDSNPFATVGGRPVSQEAFAWETGWLNGQGKRACDLSWHRHVARGGD